MLIDLNEPGYPYKKKKVKIFTKTFILYIYKAALDSFNNKNWIKIREETFFVLRVEGKCYLFPRNILLSDKITIADTRKFLLSFSTVYIYGIWGSTWILYIDKRSLLEQTLEKITILRKVVIMDSFFFYIDIYFINENFLSQIINYNLVSFFSMQKLYKLVKYWWFKNTS